MDIESMVSLCRSWQETYQPMKSGIDCCARRFETTNSGNYRNEIITHRGSKIAEIRPERQKSEKKYMNGERDVYFVLDPELITIKHVGSYQKI